MALPITLGVGGGVIDSTNSGVTRIDSYFGGSGDLVLRRVASNFLQINSAPSRPSTNTGRTIIESGAVRVTGGYAIGDASVVSISNGATFQVRNSETIGGLSGAGTVTTIGDPNTLTIGGSDSNESFSGVLKDESGSRQLALIKIGTGTQTLSGTNTYTGSTTINEGALFVNGEIANTTVTVNNGGEFGGLGKAGGDLTVKSGGILSAGTTASPAGSLTVDGSVNLESGSTISLTLNADLSHSTLVANGGSWVFDSTQAFSFVDNGAVTGTYIGLITGLTADPGATGAWVIVNPEWAGTFSYNGTTQSIDLALNTVPEPATWSLVLLGLAASLYAARRVSNRRKTTVS